MSPASILRIPAYKNGRFVSALLQVEDQLLSAGGDSNIFVWSLTSHTQTKLIDVSSMKDWCIVKPEKAAPLPQGKKGRRRNEKGKGKAKEDEEMVIQVSPSVNGEAMEAEPAPSQEAIATEANLNTKEVAGSQLEEAGEDEEARDRFQKGIVIRKIVQVKDDLIAFYSVG